MRNFHSYHECRMNGESQLLEEFRVESSSSCSNSWGIGLFPCNSWFPGFGISGRFSLKLWMTIEMSWSYWTPAEGLICLYERRTWLCIRISNAQRGKQSLRWLEKKNLSRSKKDSSTLMMHFPYFYSTHSSFWASSRIIPRDFKNACFFRDVCRQAIHISCRKC
jgi:hypothetical protein